MPVVSAFNLSVSSLVLRGLAALNDELSPKVLFAVATF